MDASLIRANASEARAADKGEQAQNEDEAPRKKISLTDPAARWTAAIGGRANKNRNISTCRVRQSYHVLVMCWKIGAT